MMLMSQCGTMNVWAVNIFPAFASSGYMNEKECDLVETQDIMDFQQFTTLIGVYGEATYRLPNITGTGVPVSTLFAAHHNLVTYGVPFMWVRPKQDPHRKRYYSPEVAVQKLASGQLFAGDSIVQTWVAKNRAAMEPPSVAEVPGMAKWVELAQACFAGEGDSADCTKFPGWFKRWHGTHPDSDNSSLEDGER